MSSFDREKLLNEFGGDWEIVVEVAQVFFEEFETMVSDVLLAVEVGEASKVEIAAHTFKGVASNLKAGDLQDLSLQIELSARSGDLKKARELLESFEVCARTFQKDLRTFVEERGAA